jgi:PAS domain S-box-containing protein
MTVGGTRSHMTENASGAGSGQKPAPGFQSQISGKAPGLDSLRRNLPRDYMRLEVAIDATSLGVWEWDVESGGVYWSDRMREILGIGKDVAADYELWVSLLHPEDAANVRAAAHQLLDPSSGGRMHLQHRVLLPTGEVSWIESHGQMIYEDGRPVRLLGTVTDITARKRTEDELIQSLAALEVTLDAADAVPWQYNTATRELRWSYRVTELFDFNDGDRYPSMDAFLASIHPEEQAQLIALRAAERAAAPGEKFTLQLRLKRRDGGWRWIERRSIVGQDEPGGRWVYGVDLDISERRKASEILSDTVKSLERERERLEIALLTGRLGVYEWRVGEELVWWSPEIYPLFGVDPASFIPTVTGFNAMVHPDDLAVLEQKTRAALADGSSFEHEYRIVRPDGQMRWISNRSRAIRDAQGNEERVVGVATDITDRKRQEEQVLLLMREVNHRSKNLLAVVQAVASQSARSSSPEEFSQRFAERLQGLAASLDLLVHNNWQGVALGELVLSQLSHFSDLLGERVLFGGPQVTVRPAAAQAIGMALHELATNASKYGALATSGGRVEISWEITLEKHVQTLRMKWRESGGPAVCPPSHRGFGTSIMTAVLGNAVSGEASLDYREEGLVWNLEAPLAAL